MPQATSLATFWALESLVLATSTTFLVVTATVVSQDTPPNLIGKTMAMFLFLQGLVGPAIAPTITAFLADYIFTGQRHALGTAMSVVAAACGCLGIAASMILWRRLRTVGAARV